MIYLNTSQDVIPQDIFDDLVVGTLLHDDNLSKFKEATGLLTIALHKIMRYNLIFKKNAFIYAKKKTVTKTLKDSSLDFKTVLNAELKALLD